MRNLIKFSSRHKKRSGLRAPVLVLAAIVGGLSATLPQNESVAQFLQPALETITGAASCNIKGNVSYNNGTRIYHVPGQEHYSETIISQRRGERWFCSEEEARANGWRKARR